MEDNRIVDLYWARSESAIRETEIKYGRLLTGISRSLLSSAEDAEECVNDTYLAAWNSMPQERPDYLGAFLSKIVRRISIDRFRAAHRQKRGGAGQLVDELTDCIPDGASLDDELENGRLADALNRFLLSLDSEKRTMFVLRYFYSKPITDIAARLGVSVPKVKTDLFRIRDKLRAMLEKEELL